MPKIKQQQSTAAQSLAHHENLAANQSVPAQESLTNQGIMHQAANVAKKSASATIGATIGAVIGLILPIPGGAFIGALVGGLIGRAAEPAINKVFGVDENAATNTTKSEAKLTLQPAPASQLDNKIVNTAQMTQIMGGHNFKAAITANSQEQAVLSPEHKPKAKQSPTPEAGSHNSLAAAFFISEGPRPPVSVLGGPTASQQEEPEADNNKKSSLFSTPKLTMSRAASGG